MRRAAEAAALAVLVIAGTAVAVTGNWWQVWLIGFPLIYGGAYGIIDGIGKRKKQENDKDS